MITKNRFAFLMIILVYAMTPVCAQDTLSTVSSGKKCSCGFSSITQAGTAAGQSMPQWIVQSVNGIRYKEWFAGIGAGIDFYRYRTIPVFLDLRRYWSQKITTPFIYVDGGINLQWLMEHEKPTFLEEDFKTGWYFDAGLGYRLSIGGKHGILLSAGYSEKNTKGKRFVGSYYCPSQPCPQTEKFSYTFKRYVFKLGWQF